MYKCQTMLIHVYTHHALSARWRNNRGRLSNTNPGCLDSHVWEPSGVRILHKRSFLAKNAGLYDSIGAFVFRSLVRSPSVSPRDREALSASHFANRASDMIVVIGMRNPRSTPSNECMTGSFCSPEISQPSLSLSSSNLWTEKFPSPFPNSASNFLFAASPPRPTSP